MINCTDVRQAASDTGIMSSTNSSAPNRVDSFPSSNLPVYCSSYYNIFDAFGEVISKGFSLLLPLRALIELGSKAFLS